MMQVASYNQHQGQDLIASNQSCDLTHSGRLQLALEYKQNHQLIGDSHLRIDQSDKRLGIGYTLSGIYHTF